MVGPKDVSPFGNFGILKTCHALNHEFSESLYRDEVVTFSFGGAGLLEITNRHGTAWHPRWDELKGQGFYDLPYHKIGKIVINIEASSCDKMDDQGLLYSL